VIATLQENPTQLQRVLAGFGWSLREPNVEVMYRSPVDIYIDEWVYDLMDAVERTKARRILIDSLADLRISAGDEMRFHEFIYSIVQRFSRQGVSVLMTSESPRLFGADRISDSAFSPLADNVVMLSYQRERDTISRTMAVMKTRASRHDPTVRTFVIGPQGIVLDEPPSAIQDSHRNDSGLASVPTSPTTS
jgi:circadian clock protein KaiC